jgi:hypothetical protein
MNGFFSDLQKRLTFYSMGNLTVCHGTFMTLCTVDDGAIFRGCFK